jgi:protoheme ferro-lyase
MENNKLLAILVEIDEGTKTPFKAYNEILNLFNVSSCFTVTCGNKDIVEICKTEEIANSIRDRYQEKDKYNSYWVDKVELK